MLKVLVACEFSGVVRNALNAYHGVHAISCDLLPAEDGRDDYHYQGDVFDIIDYGWDALIAFPPCTRLANSGVRWLKERNLWNELEEGARFFNRLLKSKIPHKLLENPIQHKYARERIRKYDQIIQPWMFGHYETKATCLWLDNLPELRLIYKTKQECAEALGLSVNDKPKARVHEESPGPNRWMERSRTLPGFAQEMADQWIPYILEQEKA